MIVQMQLRELRVAVPQLECHVPLRLAGPRTNFGELVLEAVRQINTRTMLSSGHRIADRPSLELEYILYPNLSAA